MPLIGWGTLHFWWRGTTFIYGAQQYVDEEAGSAKELQEPEAAEEEADPEPTAAVPAAPAEVEDSHFGYIFIKPKVAQEVIDDFFVKLAESKFLKKEGSAEITLNADQSAIVLEGSARESELVQYLLPVCCVCVFCNIYLLDWSTLLHQLLHVDLAYPLSA
jgi:hypothetical protein